MVGVPEFTHGRATVMAANTLILSAIRKLNDAKHKKETAICAAAPSSPWDFVTR